MKNISLKLLVISYLLLVGVNVSFAQSYPVACPSEAQAIVNAVGGCSAVDKDQYSAVYDNCCVVSSVTGFQGKTALWIVLAVLVLGFGVVGMRYYLRKRKNDLSSPAKRGIQEI